MLPGRRARSVEAQTTERFRQSKQFGRHDAVLDLLALLGFLLGWMLAYFIELRRRHNAQWSW